MNFQIAVIPGDGIGPEIINEAIKVLETIGKKYHHHFHFQKLLAGGCAIDKVGTCLPDETLDLCKKSDSILLGAVGGPKWDTLPGEQRPEKALLRLRKELNLFANLRPALLFPQLKDACPLKKEIVGNGIDICVVRELTGGIYFGEKGRKSSDIMGEIAYDVESYSVSEIKRIAKIAFEIAGKRKKKVTSVDKANVLESSKLWRSVVEEIANDYPDITLHHMYIDNASMQLIRDPKQFDVIVTSNMFGDILSDEASIITGSIGMLPSASLGNSTLGMYEPIHGSAPDIAGKNKANPIATILSAAMMLRYSFNLNKEAQAIEDAVTKVLKQGYRTPDLIHTEMQLVSTKEMGEQIIKNI
ncbi:3-isopropylmalate dehydrogenase [Garciella nitratireducens]|uniref:3-isopropylmalate dehydrogenase n=1 Tax=Garciella nitratireducens DSM 15102 TaxID=1121911 RepID=A0A1T4MQT0_9FIRM|nr:3-isopropylmalate dehydrogenase [Garciella nitratireducens]RBP44987.1 3-isopropylmalate dehydrogenase [Garciella nitratireducens]SJZ69470.1 3-isopropylmalate dehydrogenase [Garciella nitratireducens DSM 15102]